MTELTPELLLHAYASGVFPMAESRDDEQLFWVDPDERGIIPLDGLHISRSLRKTVRKRRFDIRCNSAFTEVMLGCAATADDREDTWINSEIIRLYTGLHQMGFAHSVEAWRQGQLAGGLYGVSLGGVFFGESMFSRQTDASKVALVHLVARLRFSGFVLLDTQFVTSHLRTLGAVEIPRAVYKQRLNKALNLSCRFYSGPETPELESELFSLLTQPSTHTS